jgi:hypothetical protein
VYELKYVANDTRLFLWMQDGDAAGDEAKVAEFFAAIANPEAAARARAAPLVAPGEEGSGAPLDLSSLLAGMGAGVGPSPARAEAASGAAFASPGPAAAAAGGGGGGAPASAGLAGSGAGAASGLGASAAGGAAGVSGISGISGAPGGAGAPVDARCVQRAGSGAAPPAPTPLSFLTNAPPPPSSLP